MRICPLPGPWSDVYQRLNTYARMHSCKPPTPPWPLVLSGWTGSNDAEKALRWEATVDWATRNGCNELLSDLTDTEFLMSSIVAKDEIDLPGEHKSPLERHAFRIRPSILIQAAWLEVLGRRWAEIAGEGLAVRMRPLAFIGVGCRSLLIEADRCLNPPWGTWTQVDPDNQAKQAFRTFRAAVNRAIAPHQVDHIEFWLSEMADESGSTASR